MLNGKVAIVTGGTRGIGLATVRLFLKNGAKVVLFGSREESVNKAIMELKNEDSTYQVLGFFPTIYDENEVSLVFDQVKEKFGKIDIVVNNAGVSSATPISNYTDEEYEKISDINIKSVFVVSKVAVPYLEETRGVIVNVSSMVSIYGQPSGIGYPTSKFAVNGFTKSLARELAPFNIRVNAVAPGITKTDMIESLPKEMINTLVDSIPLGRMGKPKDIANAFLFLASDMASYISGVVLQVDGLARN